MTGLRIVLAQALRHYLLALQFFTRIPVTGRLADWVGFSPAMLRASAAHFPGIGWLVGGLAAALSVLLFMALPVTPMTPLLVAMLGTICTVRLTGAFHEDGLADVADGLGGSYNRERALSIMKDSRVGAFGAIAVVLALLCKVALLAVLGSISPWLACAALWLAHVLSRFFPLLTIRLLPHVGDADGTKSKPLAEQISGPALLVAIVWALLAVAAAWWLGQGAVPQFTVPQLIAAIVACLLGWAYMWRMFANRLQGFTGDCLGATQQVCEVAFYLGLCLAL